MMNIIFSNNVMNISFLNNLPNTTNPMSPVKLFYNSELKGALQLRLTGSTAQPMTSVVCRFKKLSVPVISCLWVFRCLFS